MSGHDLDQLPDDVDVVIVGAGQAGVSLSNSLKKLGIAHVVLERDTAFSAWRNRWDDFRTNTPNWMNTLPILPRDRYPGNDAGGFASRDEMVSYLDDSLVVVDPPMATDVEAKRVTRQSDDEWLVETSKGPIRARCVVLCHGAMSEPRIPAFASQLGDSVPQLHSEHYRNPTQIETGSVLVVGSGSSGVQISTLLAESGRFDAIHMAVSDVLVLPRHVLGIPIHRLVHAFGLFDIPATSFLGRRMYSGLETRGDPIRRPDPDDLHRDYGMELHGRLEAIDAEGIHFADGSVLPAEDLTVIWCTGYRGDYAMLADESGILDERGFPIHDRGVSGSARGLYFVGLRYQHTVASHDLYGVAADAEHVAQRIQERLGGLKMVATHCRVCEGDQAPTIATGFDYEYRTSPEEFKVSRCDVCGTVFLNPRPDVSEFSRIYPESYHTLEFSEDSYGFVHEVRSRLEARRLLRYCKGMPADARILDVGCGDGFHLSLLRDYGPKGWTLRGVDVDERATALGRERGLDILTGTLDDVRIEDSSVDLVYTLQTLEHVAEPDTFLRSIHRVLTPGGRLVVVTDNTRSFDFTLFRRRYWGGYHFPRHWYLFNKSNLRRLADKTGFDTEVIKTVVSPVNWVYSIHNALVGLGAPQWLVNRFTLKSTVSLGLFTLLDALLQFTGRGALLNGYFTKSRT